MNDFKAPAVGSFAKAPLALEEGLVSPASSPPTYFSEDDLIARHILPHYACFVSPTSFQEFSCEDPQRKELALTTQEIFFQKQTVERLSPIIGRAAAIKDASRLIKTAKNWAKPLRETPAPFAFKSENKYSFNKLDFDISPGPFPAWQEFLDRIPNQQNEFMAFVYSIFELKHTGRQILYLYGDAESGKSKIIEAVSSVFRDSVGALNSAAIKNNSRFLFSSVYGKRLVAAPDLKNPKIIMSEPMRNITSGDRVPIEFKGKDIFSAPLYCRVMIASNMLPQNTSDKADLSRLIPIHVKGAGSDDNTWLSRLISELPHFLHACREVYALKCPTHHTIQLSRETIDFRNSCAEQFEERWHVLFEEYLVADASGSVSASDMRRVIFDSKKMSDFEIADFYSFMSRVHKVNRSKNRKDSNRIHYFGVRLKGEIKECEF